MPEGTELNLEGPILLDLEDMTSELPDEGWHLVTIERADAGASRQKKLPQIFCVSRCIDTNDPYLGKTIVWNSIFSGPATSFTKRMLRAVGFTGNVSIRSIADLKELADKLVGRTVEVKVTHRKYKDEMRYNVNSWRAEQVVTMPTPEGELDVPF